MMACQYHYFVSCSQKRRRTTQITIERWTHMVLHLAYMFSAIITFFWKKIKCRQAFLSAFSLCHWWQTPLKLSKKSAIFGWRGKAIIKKTVFVHTVTKHSWQPSRNDSWIRWHLFKWIKEKTKIKFQKKKEKEENTRMCAVGGNIYSYYWEWQHLTCNSSDGFVPHTWPGAPGFS